MTSLKGHARLSALLAMVVSCVVLASPPASAQATRTWVSGVGDDANPCSRTAPCKTFAGAISKTAPNGEINVLDSGGFGAVTITKPITIDGGGNIAGVLVAGTNGIVISAGASDTVTLRNLLLDGILGSASPGLNGVNFNTGAALIIENCRIYGFSQNGININANTASAVRVSVSDTTISNSNAGMIVKNAGSGRVTVSLHHVSLLKNATFGYKGDATTGTAPIFSSISDSFVAVNGTGVWSAGGAAGGSLIQITRSSIVNNSTNGVQSDGSSNATALLSNTLVSGNGTGVSAAGGAGLVTYKNNAVNGNTSDGAFTTQVTPE
jgi:hypothetical protein